MKSLSLSVIDKEEDFIAIKNDWESIYNNNEYSIFSSYVWSFNYWKNIHRGKKLNIIIIKNNLGEIVGIFPLVRKQYLFWTVFEFISNVDSDKNDILIKPGYEDSSFNLLRNFFERNFFILKNLTKESIFYNSIIRLGNKQKSYIRKGNISPYIDINFNWDDFKKNIKKKLINDSNRQWRKLSEIGLLKIEKATKKSEIKLLIDCLDNFKNDRAYKSLIAKNILSKRGMKKFLNDISEQFLKTNNLSLIALKMSNSVLAVHLAFYHNNQYLYYLPSFNSEYKKYSPGRLLLEKSIEYAIDRKFKKFDFLNGNESYKYNYSNDVTEIYNYSNLKMNFVGRLIEFFINTVYPFLAEIKILRKIRHFLKIIFN